MHSNRLIIFLLALPQAVIKAQDYEVADIDCDFGTESGVGERLSARLKKPEGFRGFPIFADDRRIDPSIDSKCQIRRDPSDPQGLIYNLLVTTFDRCAVFRKNGFVNVRIWFPRMRGIMALNDQEVIIMCKPPMSTVVENKAAGFAGSIPSTGRVSGIVEESPGKLEYIVALYRETSNAANGENFVVPVDDAVPIGTKLQLRASINTRSAWKYAKLLDVTVSNQHDNPFAPGYISLVKDGCKNADYEDLVGLQPYKLASSPHQVFLEFEAFLLDNSENKLWIHTKLKACVKPEDCASEFCLDLFQPSGHGRRKRRGLNETEGGGESTDFGDNISMTVVMPEEFFKTRKKSMKQEDCSYLSAVAIVLGFLLALSIAVVFLIASKYNTMKSKTEITQHFFDSARHSNFLFGPTKSIPP